MKKKRKILLILGLMVALFSSNVSFASSFEGQAGVGFYGKYPDIVATAKVDKKEIDPKGQQAFNSIWTIKNLLPGVRYTLKTQVIDVTDNNRMLPDFKGELVIIPTSSEDYTAIVSVKGDASNLAGHTLVTIGTLVDDEDKVVMTHEDLSDKNMITLVKKPKAAVVPSLPSPAPKPSGFLPKTGEAASLLSVFGILLLLILWFLLKRRKDEEEEEETKETEEGSEVTPTKKRLRVRTSRRPKRTSERRQSKRK